MTATAGTNFAVPFQGPVQVLTPLKNLFTLFQSIRSSPPKLLTDMVVSHSSGTRHVLSHIFFLSVNNLST